MGRNGLYSPLGIETIALSTKPTSLLLPEWPLQPVGCQGQLTFDPFRQLEMDPPRMVVREKAFFATVNVQLHSSAQQWRRKVYHLRNLVLRSLRSSSLS